MFEKRSKQEEQKELWVVSGKLPEATPDAFYKRLNQTLERLEVAKAVWEICAPAYADAGRGGRPGIDPVVYLKMLIVGFFENLPSARAIASRCADSLSIRGFLGYSLTEATPEHSSLSVIGARLSIEQLRQIHIVLLRTLKAHGLLRGRKLGIDSSVMEANASLRALEHRNTELGYWTYVGKLAAEAGVDSSDDKAVRRFDKNRKGRKTSNEDWKNPHDPDAKVGRTKHGATDMIYKPEHVTDLESGAIVDADVRPGNAADNDESLCERVMEAVAVLHQVDPKVPLEKLGRELCADEGYFSIEQIRQLQECDVRTVISDPHAAKRRKDKMTPENRVTLNKAARATRSKSGKRLLRKRGEHIERGIGHVLDHGGLRRTTLRGREKIAKRYLVAVIGFNLHLLLRKLTGFGTPKQALAGVLGALSTHLQRFIESVLLWVGIFFATLRIPQLPTQFLRTNFAFC
jgi:transposase